MKLNHAAHRLDTRHFDLIVEMLTTRLGLIVLRRTDGGVWLRQPGANVDLQFTASDSTSRDPDKRGSQVAFLSESPRAELERLAEWLQCRGLDATVGHWSDREFYLDAPAAFVDFVIEAMTPDMADYDLPA